MYIYKILFEYRFDYVCTVEFIIYYLHFLHIYLTVYIYLLNFAGWFQLARWSFVNMFFSPTWVVFSSAPSHQKSGFTPTKTNIAIEIIIYSGVFLGVFLT